ncbi:MAG: hypothetical protein JWN03_7546 [Nocardia sp.]|uniref:hypothetical protein n=1 Tax=Nocardia sp. TaxID=1821 RepID=UPI00260948F5|nr:hypothetical protein [Nocardia sp.]MCU1647271.1 hypothetical protein [Nocardia sp.]
MTSPPAPAPSGGVEVALMARPKSGVWQRLVGAPVVAAYGLLGELSRIVILDSFKENRLVSLLTGVLGWMPLLIFVIGGLVWVFRATADVGTARRAGTAELTETGGPWPAPGWPMMNSALDGDMTAAVLRDMPLRDFEIAALLGVLTAAAGAQARLPVTAPGGETRTATEVLAALVGRGALSSIGPGRYRLVAAPRQPESALVRTKPEWRAAFAESLRQHAEQATAWAAALDAPDTVSAARQWFRAEEPRLRRLLLSCAGLRELPQVRAVVPHLAAISDALDSWYARTGGGEDVDIATAMERMAAVGHFPVLEELARIRRRPPRAKLRGYRPRSLFTSLRARAAHRQALAELEVAAPRLGFAANLLEAAWWLLPREDVAGEVCALVNLGTVHIRQGRLDAARDRLELAESLAGGGRDPAGLAHVHELMGVLGWAAGEPHRALRHWQTALSEWRGLADDVGIARCLQHLGSVAVTAPALSAFLVEAHGNSSATAVLRQASGWLAHAKQLNPAARCAETYWRKAALALGAVSGPLPLATIDRWPLVPAAADAAPST